MGMENTFTALALCLLGQYILLMAVYFLYHFLMLWCHSSLCSPFPFSDSSCLSNSLHGNCNTAEKGMRWCSCWEAGGSGLQSQQSWFMQVPQQPCFALCCWFDSQNIIVKLLIQPAMFQLLIQPAMFPLPPCLNKIQGITQFKSLEQDINGLFRVYISVLKVYPQSTRP